MSAKIATLSVMLTASAGAFTNTIAGAGRQLASFGSSITSIGSKVIGFGGALSAIAAGGSLAYLTKQSMEHIDTTAKLADRLGATTEGLVGLEHGASLAGISAESMQAALEKMQKALGGATEDGSKTADVLQSLGLNGKELASMNADDAFKAIAESISKIQNPVERANAELKLFGKAGQALDPLLTQGAAGIEAATEEAKKLGLTFSRVDAAKVEQANDAITRMESVFTGVTNQIAIGLAPYIDAAATKFTELAEKGDIAGKVGGAIEWVAHAIAVAADYLELLPAGFHGFRAGALEAIAGVLGGLDSFTQVAAKVINFFGGHVEWTALADLKQGFEQVAAEEAGKFDEAMAKFHRGDNAAAVTKAFDDIKAKSTDAAKKTADNAEKMRGAFRGLEESTANLKKVSDALEKIQQETAQAGLSDSAKKLADLKADGANATQLAQAKSLLAVKDQITAIDKISTDDPLADYASKLEKLTQLYGSAKISAEQFAAIRDTAKTTLNEKLTEQAKSIVEDTKTPLQKYQDEVSKLQTLFDRHLISQDVFDKAKLKAKGTLEQAQESATPAPVASIRAGGAEAMKLAFESTHGVQVLSKDDVPKKQLNEAVAANRYLEQLLRYQRDIAGAATETPEEVNI